MQILYCLQNDVGSVESERGPMTTGYDAIALHERRLAFFGCRSLNLCCSE